MGGCVLGRTELIDRVRMTLNHYGASLDPHAGFLLARGIKTLALRVRAQNDNAMALADFLLDIPRSPPSTTLGSPPTRTTLMRRNCCPALAAC